MRKKEALILIILILLLFAINYRFIDNSLTNFLEESEIIIVKDVIDGDTIKSNETSIRLLGINSPEKGEKYYEEAKEYLEKKILNKTVYLKYGKEKYDRYHRILAYVFLGNENINLELVEKGFANFYFPSGKDNYYLEFKKAWEECIENNINLCEKSKNKCAECIELNEFNYKEEIIILKNTCSFDCDLSNWEISDEGRKRFRFSKFILRSQGYVELFVGEGEDDNDTLFWREERYVWTKTGDTLFLRDDDFRLVLWESY